MRIVVHSPLPVEEQYALIKKHFEAIPNYDAPRLDYDNSAFYKPFNLNIHVRVEGLQRTPVLQIYIPLRHPADEYKTGTLNFISSMITTDDEHTFSDEIFQQGLIRSMDTEFFRLSDQTTVLAVFFILTGKGFDDYRTIVNQFFQYTSLLAQSDVQPIFSDFKATQDINFTYRSNDPEVMTITETLKRVSQYPPHLALKVSNCAEFDQKMFNEVMAQISPQKSLVVLRAARINSITKMEPYSMLDYKTQPNDFQDLLIFQARANLKLPQINEFIPKSLKRRTPLPDAATALKLQSEVPKIAFQNDKFSGPIKTCERVFHYSGAAKYPEPRVVFSTLIY